MYQYTCDVKYCATCACWAGKRNVCDRWGSRLEVASPMDTSKCQNQNSGYRGQTKQANGGCSAFVKWEALK